MRRFVVGFFLFAVLAAGCSGGGARTSVPAQSPVAFGRYTIPAALSLAIPPTPPQITPALPSTVRRTSATHAAFFSGEAALSNGVYYLALPNGTPFGYYSYLADQNYIYHFDLGYEFVVDANDGNGGVYLYDFASSHWWYTSRQYPFPYIYDFGLSAFLYYYPDTNNAGHYTTSPRYFYDFSSHQIITLPASPTPLGSPAVTEFPIPTGASQPRGVAAGPDGAIWFTEGRGNKIGRITTTGTITEFPLPHASSVPSAITTGSDGALWFTELGSNRIGRISTAGAITEYTSPSLGVYMAAGRDGALWFTEGGPTIGKITTAGVVSEYTLPTQTGLGYIALGPDGAMWFTEGYANKLGRVTPSGIVSEFALPTAQSLPDGVAAGPDGNVWFTEYIGKIGRMTTAGAVTEFTLPSGQSRPGQIIQGGDGALWFADEGLGQIGRITPDGAVSAFTVNGAGDLIGVALGSDGGYWYVKYNSGKVGRLQFR